MFTVIRAIRNMVPDFPLRVTTKQKVRTQHVEGIHKKKAEVANQIGANRCPKCDGDYLRERVNMEIFSVR